MSDAIILPDGTEVRMGALQPDVLRFAAAPAWEERNPVLSEDECEDTQRLKQFLSPAKKQNYSNCTNAALAGIMEALERSVGVEDVQPLSMSFLYAQHNGGRDAGAYCRDLADDLRKRGLCREALWPEDRIFDRTIPKAVAEDAARHTALEIYQCLDWSHVRSALARDFFVYHGFVLGSSFFNTPKDGKVPAWDGEYANGHAMFSYGLTRHHGDLRACTMNTWGKSFGEAGACHIDKSYFWGSRGNRINLDSFAIRAIKRVDPLPVTVG